MNLGSNILLHTCALLYIANYLIGWLLHFRKITMTKKTHQIFFASIIINLLLIIIFLQLPLAKFFLCLSSLMLMLILPFGKKGGMYHVIVSTTGLILFFLIYAVDN